MILIISHFWAAVRWQACPNPTRIGCRRFGDGDAGQAHPARLLIFLECFLVGTRTLVSVLLIGGLRTARSDVWSNRNESVALTATLRNSMAESAATASETG